MPSAKPESPTRVRYAVLGMLALGAILSYLLRVALAPAGTTIQADLNIPSDVMGVVHSAFFLGYFWFQIPAGWAGQRLGARVSLATMGLLWAAATVASARADSEPLLYWSRVALGVAQAGLFPVTIMAIRDWFPRERHGLASSVITACMSMGAVLASAATTRLLEQFGWRPTFLLYAAIASGWALLFLLWFRDTPNRHPSVNPAELDLIRAEPRSSGSPPPKSAQAGSHLSPGAALLAMLSTPSMWALCAQAFFQAFGYVLFTSWFPAYLEKGRGLSVRAAGDLNMLPLLTVVVGSVAGGHLIDFLLRRTGNRWLSRSALPASGLAICAAAAFVATWADRPSVAVGIIAAGMFFTGIAMPGKWACTIDLTAGHSATGFALMNMAGNIGAWVCPRVVGDMFEGLEQGRGDWNSILLLLAGVQLVAAFFCLILNPNSPAITEPKDPGVDLGDFD